MSESCLVDTFILVDLSGGLAAVHVQQVEDALLVLGDAAGDEYLQITVGGQHLNTVLTSLKSLRLRKLLD